MSSFKLINYMLLIAVAVYIDWSKNHRVIVA